MVDHSSSSDGLSGERGSDASKVKQVQPDLLEIQKLRYEFTIGILESRYALYAWCETKMQTLAAVDSILLGAVAITIGQHYKLNSGLHDTLAGATAFFLVASLAVILWHIIPLMNSGVGNDNNPRSTVVVLQYETKERYLEHVNALQIEDLITYNSNQSYGMSKNIMRDRAAIRFAVYLTYAAIAPFVGVLVGAKFNGN